MAPISTSNLTPLPDVDSLKALLQSLAVLDCIMSPDEWDMRYFSFNAKWGRGEEMGSMRNGSGDDFFAFFNRSGCLLKGFVHQSPMTPYRENPPSIWTGLLEDVPNSFSAALVEPAFSMSDVTFCIWRLNDEKNWSTGKIKFPRSADPDGSRYLLGFLDGKPKTYQTFAEDYYETELPINSIKHVYQHRPLTTEIVESLNPDATLKMIAKDLKEIGYVTKPEK
jgi:hypothetical protein